MYGDFTMSLLNGVNVKFVDKNMAPLEIGQVVRYNIKGFKNDEEIRGWAKILDLNTESANLLPWLEESSSYSSESSIWPLFWSEENGCYVASGSDQNATFDLTVEEAEAFDAPIDYWPDLLSLLATSFINEEKLKFSIRGNQLDTIQVSDPNGFLPAFVFLAEQTRKSIFHDTDSALVFYANDKSIAGMSFLFDNERSPKQNTLYFHTHFLLDAMITMVEKYKKSTEYEENQVIPLDTLVADWLLACEKKQVDVLPFRPVLNSIKGTRRTTPSSTAPGSQQGARGGKL